MSGANNVKFKRQAPKHSKRKQIMTQVPTRKNKGKIDMVYQIWNKGILNLEVTYGLSISFTPSFSYGSVVDAYSSRFIFFL
jgi:hypothetical protein